MIGWERAARDRCRQGARATGRHGSSPAVVRPWGWPGSGVWSGSRQQRSERGATPHSQDQTATGTRACLAGPREWGGQQVPEGLTGVAAGEVEADARGQFADAAADLEQTQAQRVELERGVALGAQATPQGVE